MDISQVHTYEAGVTLASATRNVHKVFTAMLRPYDITCMQWFVLGTISDSGAKGIKLSLLSDKMQTGLPFITNTINLLESKGWVERKDSLVDSRSKSVSITKAYNKRVAQIEVELRAKMRVTLYRDIKPADLAIFLGVLESLAGLGSVV